MAPEARDAEEIVAVATEVLEDLQAIDVVKLDVRHLTSLMDYMLIASGRSDRHVRAIADELQERCKSAGIRVVSKEGTEAGEWILVDLVDVVVHIMLPRTRDFYELEKLWSISQSGSDADRASLRIR